MKDKLNKEQRQASELETDLREVINKHSNYGILTVTVIGIMDLIKHEMLTGIGVE